MKKSKLITIIGSPASGKSTLAGDINIQLKKMGENSIFIGEAATDYIAEYGIPNTPSDQLVIFYKQCNKERVYIDTKDYIICDSSGILNYFYFRSLFNTKLTQKDIAIINHMQKEILKTINQWDYIFYVPPILENTEDGIRYHKKDDIIKLDNLIKSYLTLENIPFHDLSDIPINNRKDEVIKIITTKKPNL